MPARATSPPTTSSRTPRRPPRNERPPLLVLEPLQAFLDEHGLGEGEIEAEPIGDGHSNVTYLITRGDDRVRPAPPAAPAAAAVSAHDVLREARVLRALAGHRRARARGARGLRRRVRDRRAVLRDGAPRGPRDHDRDPARARHAEERRRMSDELVDALVEIHAVDWAGRRPGGLRQADGLPRAPAAALPRPLGAQQDARASRRSSASARGSPRTCRESPARRRSSTATTAWATRCSRRESPARLVAIFDWEMATIGDPLADLGYLIARCGRAATTRRSACSSSTVTREEGFPRRDELSRATRSAPAAR